MPYAMRVARAIIFCFAAVVGRHASSAHEPVLLLHSIGQSFVSLCASWHATVQVE